MHEKAEAVVRHSILKNTTAKVDITMTRDVIEWQTLPTGFSTHRYMVPRLCNFEGFAIYLDVDMLLLSDIRELWEYRRPDAWCITRATRKGEVRDEVAVIDCSAFRDLPGEDQLAERDGKGRARAWIGKRYQRIIPDSWNARLLPPCAKGCCSNPGFGCDMHVNPAASPCFERVDLIHFTCLENQPWHPDPGVDYKPFPCKATERLFWKHYNEVSL